MNRIEYLPIARQDIDDIIHYIAYTLCSPKAALNLLDSFERAILRTADFPNMYPVYEPTSGFKHPYRYIPVKNYLVFYVVMDDVIEVRRVIYAKKNLDDLGFITDK